MPDHTKIMKVGQHPPLERSPTPELAALMTPEDKTLYRNALTCRNSNFGLGGVAYLRRVVENRMNDLIDLVVDTARALGDDSPALARAEELKADKRFTAKVEFATPLVPKTLVKGGHNPMAELHDLASEAVHSRSEDECTETFDKSKLAFEYLIKNLEVSRDEAEQFVRAMDKLKSARESKGS